MLAFALSVGLPARAEPGASSKPWLPTVAFSGDGILLEWDDWAALSFGGLFQGDWGYIQKDAFVTPSGWEGELRRARYAWGT